VRLLCLRNAALMGKSTVAFAAAESPPLHCPILAASMSVLRHRAIAAPGKSCSVGVIGDRRVCPHGWLAPLLSNVLEHIGLRVTNV
jgi:hypothetical protein